MNVLVVGATGVLGLEIVKRLKAQGHAVAGLVRAGSPGEPALRKLGVEIRWGDLRKPETLQTACAGIDTVVSTATSVVKGGGENSLAAVDGAGTLALIETARRQGVKRFVYISASPKLQESCPLVAHKRAAEKALVASGVEYVIVQPSSFMDVWFSPALGWDLKAGKAQIFGAGDAPLSYVCIADVAAYTVAVLLDPRVKDQVIPLGGPEAITPREALQVIEQVVGKKFKVTTLPGFVPRAAAAVLKPFNPKLASLMALGAETLTGDPIDLSKARALADVRLTPLAEWAATQT